MKGFFKMMFASFAGVLLAGMAGAVLLLIVVIGSVGAALSSAPGGGVSVQPNSIYRIMLDRPVAERSRVKLSAGGLFSLSVESTIGLTDLLKSIEQAAFDGHIKMIYLDLSTLRAGMAQVEELREALQSFKETSGKPVIAYADNYSQAAYYLATVADKVYLNPYGSAALTGLSAQVLFYKNLLEKLQVEMQVVRHGKFKSAVEPFVSDRMSAENREQYSTFINDIWGHWLRGIAAARGLDAADIHRWADRLELNTAQAVLEHGLVDELMYKDELLQKLCSLMGEADEQQLKMIDVADYLPWSQATGKAKHHIAVVYADGEIIMGKETDGENITAWEYANTLRQLRRDNSVQAVVFRVNSPGGSAQASEIIARELRLLKEEKPVVVSMGNYAASGGYWIAAPATKIVVNPTSLTGSIGVFGVIPNMEKGLNSHLGVTVDVVKSNTSADFPSALRPMTEHERRAMQAGVDTIYTQFTGHVAATRGLPIEKVDELGQGRIWSGLHAVELGLADHLGGLTGALSEAANLAGLDNYQVIELPRLKTPFEQVMTLLTSGAMFAKAPLPAEIRTAEQLLQHLQQPGTYARLPFEVEVE